MTVMWGGVLLGAYLVVAVVVGSIVGRAIHAGTGEDDGDE